MPAPSDILQFMQGQLFQTPTLPSGINFAGKTVVVTGGNSGLGFECAKQLYAFPNSLPLPFANLKWYTIQLNVSNLILGCRSLPKGEEAKRLLQLQNKKGVTTISVWQLDMSNYDSVQSFARRVETELPRLDVLVANAGISTNVFRLAEGLEETLTVNVISTFLLSLLLLPVLEKTARETGQPGHLSITGSVVHCFADHTQLLAAPKGKSFETLSDPKTADMGARYFVSKLIVLQCVQELAKRIPMLDSEKGNGAKSSVILNFPNPGWCKTALFREDDGGAFARNLLRLIGRTATVGARTLTAAINAGTETHGKYLSECRVKPASVWVRSAEGLEVQGRVWEELLSTLEGVQSGVTSVLV